MTDPSKTLSENYIPWLKEIDSIIGRDARGPHRLSLFMADGLGDRRELDPHEAIADAINRLEADVEK